VRDLKAVAFLLLVACGNGDGRPAREGPRPDVVLIVIDTLRADHLGSYGYTRNTSPHIDSLAADATRYTRAFSHAPWTTPSVAALLTSMYPSSLGIDNVQSPLPDAAVLLPELLRDAGYRTAGFVSHSFVSKKWGFAQGFETFDESNVKGHLATTSPQLSNAALAWLEDNIGGEAPLFLLIHYFDPHFGYLDQREFPFGGRDPGYAGPVRSGSLPARFAEAPEQLAPGDLRELQRLYDSEIALTDREVGRVLDFLRNKGRYDSSIVVLAGDHGEEFLDHGALDHTKTLYDELMHVPLIVKLPGRPPSTVDSPVALVDVFPTIADWLELELPKDARGTSLISNAAALPRPIFLETLRLRRLRGVVQGNMKLIVDLDSGEVQLFDLATDPQEATNLSAERPEQVDALRRVVDAWAGGGPSLEGERLELSDEEREQLRALGYL
jgi:arylsulfatase A-like enzyme